MRIDPVRDWYVLIAVAAILLIGIISWNVRPIDTATGAGVAGELTTSAPEEFNLASLDTIHAIFSNRATERMKYKTGKYRFADPSQ